MIEERYEIIKLLGKGRTGGVYEAEDTRLKRKVALRRFFSQSENSNVSDYKDDFVAISQNLSAMQHPNLLRVYDAGVDSDGAFIISQLLKGDSLHNRLKEKPLPTWDVYDLASQMLDALSTAHHAGFVHGAITPGSILMSPRARGGHLYVILDMGLCRLAPLIQGEDSVLSMMADPAILAPELFDGSQADARADLYMLGHILYMCLAGGHPFAGESLSKCKELHHEGLPPLETYAPDAPADFVDWISWLCKVDPDDRPSSAGKALNALPKVPKPVPANVRSSPVAVPLVTGSAPHTSVPSQGAQTQSSLSTMTGPLTGNPSSTTGPTPGSNSSQFSQEATAPKKSKKLGLIFSSIALMAVVMGTVIILSNKEEVEDSDGKSQQNKPSANENPAKAAPTASEMRADAEQIEKSKQVLGIFANSDDKADKMATFESSAEWQIIGKDNVQESATELSFKDTNATDNPGIKHQFSRTQVNNIFDLGWIVTYKVKAKAGKHMMGWNLSDAQNSEWVNGNKGVSCGITVERKGNDVIVSDAFRSSKQTILNDNGDAQITITAQCRAGDMEGYYDVYVNNAKAWRIRFNQKTGFGSVWNESFFSASSDSPLNEAEWSFSELSMKTQLAN